MLVDQVARQVLLAGHALNVELLAHAVWVEWGVAVRCRTLQSLFVQVHYFLAHTDGLQFRQQLPTRVLLRARVVSHEALAEEKVI